MTSPLFVPASKPELGAEEVRELLRAAGVDLSKPALLGRRGYYRDSMGKPGVNDIGIFDDAIFYHSPTAFSSFNANTDPSKHRENIAVLTPGLWRFRVGIHNQTKALSRQYKALIQAKEFTVYREGTADVPRATEDSRGFCLGNGLWRGWFGINLHKGAFTSTSSEGCQTIYPQQWSAFIGLVDGDMERHDVLSIPYLLTEREPRK